MTDDEYLQMLRVAADAAQGELYEAVATICPAGLAHHLPVQHRDRQPPWCNACGRDSRGLLRRKVDA